RICLDDYVDCMDFSDNMGNPRLTTFIDPVTGYEYHAPGNLDDSEILLAAAQITSANNPGDVDAENALEDAEHDVRMLIGAKLLTEAQTYADGVYTPAKTAYDTASAALEVSATEENQNAYYAAEVALDKAVRGINDRTAFLDLMRYLGQHF
ncbi:uncharacterized protein METZ01_LOCUS351493, partial [marine metagenome]